jgi:hypothetical protein
VCDQHRQAQLCRKVQHLDTLHLPKQLRGDVGGRRFPLEIAPPAMLIGCPVRNEEVGKEPAERRIVASPAYPNEIDKGLGFQPLGLIATPGR